MFFVMKNPKRVSLVIINIQKLLFGVVRYANDFQSS
jgi:hypothetical protein